MTDKKEEVSECKHSWKNISSKRQTVYQCEYCGIYTFEQPWVGLTDEWVPVTQGLLFEQHPWLYRPMWIAMKSGVVVQGYYEWRQGRNPDRFITDLGDEWAFNADAVMPIVKPTHPAIDARLKEKNFG